MLSIYNIENWSENKNYSVYDIYRYNNLYYYSIAKHNSGLTFDSQFSDGVIEHNGSLRPFFFFKPSYNSDIEVKPAIKKAQFSEGYTQRMIDGINSTLLPINLVFEKRSDAEARAILHFLESKKGLSFLFIPPFPWNITKIFCCESFRHTQVFASNHTITAQFFESPV